MIKAYYSDQSKVLMISTSKIHGSDYMEYLLDELEDFLDGRKELLFIPYARPGGISYDEYTEYPAKALKSKGINVTGIHEYEDPDLAIKNAAAIFVGGGNTFLLTKTLYELGLIDTLREAVVAGTPYMGSSAGSNITGLSIGTTNDMPIVYPPSFEALSLVPFNINPHYLDPDPDSKHQGETRATRINEFHFQNKQAVIGLREASWLRLEGGKLELKGPHTAPLFEAGKAMRELEQGDVSFLLS
ncbi:MAG: dipeptidase PepE [Croceimicrobium sp.]